MKRALRSSKGVDDGGAAAGGSGGAEPAQKKTARQPDRRAANSSAPKHFPAAVAIVPEVEIEQRHFFSREPCNCGTCFRASVSAPATPASAVRAFFDLTPSPNFGDAALVKIDETGDKEGCFYEIEFHSAHVAHIFAGEVPPVTELLRSMKTETLSDADIDVEERRSVFRQCMAICERLQQFEIVGKDPEMFANFFIDRQNRVYVVPSGRCICSAKLHVSMNGGERIVVEFANFMIGCMYGDKSVRIEPGKQISVHAILPYEKNGEPTDASFVDLLRLISTAKKSNSVDRFHLHPYFSTRPHRLPWHSALGSWLVRDMKTTRYQTHVDHPRQTNDAPSLRFNSGVYQDSYHAKIQSDFYALCRDTRMSTSARAVCFTDDGYAFYDVLTMGADGCRYLVRVQNPAGINIHRGLWEKVYENSIRTFVSSANPTETSHVRCHACIGMRMCNENARQKGVMLHNELMLDKLEYVDRCEKLEVREFSERNISARKVIGLLLNESVAETLRAYRDGKIHNKAEFEDFAERTAERVSFARSSTIEEARGMMWCAFETIVVTHVVARLSASRIPEARMLRFDMLLSANAINATTNLVALLMDAAVYIEQSSKAPKYLKNALWSGLQMKVSFDDSVAQRIRGNGISNLLELQKFANRGGGGSLRETIVALKQKPYCALMHREHATMRARLPFVFMSVLRSETIVDAFLYDTLNLGMIRFFSSFEDGRGIGVSMAIVSDFFVSVAEDHRIFELCNSDDRETPIYGLRESRLDEECPGCTAFVRSLKPGDESRPPCYLIHSEEFAACFGKMLRYLVLTENTLPYRLHPMILGSLLLYQSGVRKTDRHADYASMSREFSPALANAKLNESDAGLSTAEGEFKQIDRRPDGDVPVTTPLVRATRLRNLYVMATRDCSTLIDENYKWVKTVSEAFYTPLLRMLIHTVCESSPSKLSALVSGRETPLDSDAVLKNTHLSFDYLQEEFHTHRPENAGSMNKYTFFVIGSLQAALRELDSAARDTMQSSSAVDSVRGETRALIQAVIDSLKETDTLGFSQVVNIVRKLFCNSRFLAAFILTHSHTLFGDRVKNIARFILRHAIARTVEYWLRWVCTASQNDLRRFVYLCTGRHKLENRATIGGNATEMALEIAETFSRVDAANTRPGAYDELERTCVLSHAATLSQASILFKGRADSNQMRVTFMGNSMASLDVAYVGVVHPEFARLAKLLVPEFSANEFRLKDEMAILHNWSSLCGRLPVFSTCGRYVSLFVYDSYEQFESVMKIALTEAASFSLY